MSSAIGDSSSDPTWSAMLWGMIADRGDAPVLQERKNTGWQPISWRAFGQRIESIGSALLASGLARGDRGCILGATGADWLAIDAGMMSIGMISAGVYPTEPPDRLAYIAGDCGARILFVDSEAQLAKGLAVLERCPNLKAIVAFGFVPLDDHPAVTTLDSWILNCDSDQGRFGDARSQVQADDGAILVYTSGTTGQPKGALVTHGAIAWQVEHSARLYHPEPGWSRPSYLPLCHIAERYFTFFAMHGDGVSYMVDTPANFGSAVTEIRPQFILGVPRIFEKFHEAFQASDLDKSIPHLAAALDRGMLIADEILAGREAPLLLRDRTRQDAEPLVAARAALGLERVQMLASGGAAFAPDLLRWFLALGIPMLEMYGMSESGVIASNLPSSIRGSTVGKVCDFTDVMLRPSGEIAVRGRGVFSRYWGKPEATAAAFEDGWFLTGDIGRFDESGHLSIVGRIKEIFITSGGKNISPAEIESRLRASPLLLDAIAIGDGRKFVSALLQIDEIAVANAVQLSPDIALLARDSRVQALLKAEVDVANSGLSHVEQVKTFRVLPRALSQDFDELTPTLKVKRAVVTSNFSSLVEEMYSI